MLVHLSEQFPPCPAVDDFRLADVSLDEPGGSMLQVQRFTKLPTKIAAAVGLELDQDIMGLGLHLPIEATQSTSMEEHLHGERGKEDAGRKKQSGLVPSPLGASQANLTQS